MRLYYDFHIHSALSPCGSNDMTPNNIVNMAILKGLDIIAVSDHNSAKNLPAIMEAGRKNGLPVIPGMEIETQEEVHVLALFPSLEAALEVGGEVYDHLPPIAIEEEIFGEQWVIDSDDQMLRKEERMLITACSLDIFETFDMVRRCSGLAVPAHVDRHSYSVLSNLGFIPPELETTVIEISVKTDADTYLSNREELAGYGILRNSDAHYLWDINERIHYMDINDNELGRIIQKFI